MIACLVMPLHAVAQTRQGMLVGTVTDEVDGSPVVGASIFFPELKEGVITDIDGRYSISRLPAKKTVIQVSYVGHQTIVADVDLQHTSTLDFVLKESNAMLDEVVVTGLTSNSLMKDSPSPVSVVTSTMLSHVSSSNIIDAVAHQPGVSQITTGSGISKPVIRGLGYNRVVVVNNGIRQEGQQWGDEHGIEIDPQTVGSVEIMKGAASLMYGSDAMAGVLVFHDAPMPSRGQLKGGVTAEYQTNNGLFGYSLNLAGNHGGFVWSTRYSDKMAHAYKNKYDGYVFNSGFRERAFTQLLGLNRNWGYSHLTLSYYHITPGIVEGERDEDTGAFIKPVAIDGEEGETIATKDDAKSYAHFLPYQQIHHYKAVFDNSFFIGDGSLKVLAGYQQNRRQEFEEVLEPDVCGLDFRLHTINYDVHYLSPVFDGWKIATGVNGMYQRSLNEGSEFLVPSYNLFDYGIFATVSKDLGSLHFSGGIRFDSRHLRSHSLTDDGEERFAAFSRTFNGITGSAGMVYNIADNANLRFNVSRGFRAPNISELASNGEHEGTLRYEIGNAGLKPETSWQFDLGIDCSSAFVSAQLALFANYIDNYIFLEKMSDGSGSEIVIDGQSAYRYVSGNARLLGGEFTVDFHPVEELHFENSFSYVDAVQLHQPKESRYLPFTPAPKWTSDLKYDIIRDGKTFNNTYVSVGLECYLRQSHYRSAYATETATPSYTLLNVSAGTDIRVKGRRVASLSVIGTNLTDRAYQSHLSRLKYAAVNNATGRTGVYNMGRNVTFKVVVPINVAL